MSKREKKGGSEIVFDWLSQVRGKDGVPPYYELAVTKSPSELHRNLMDWMRSNVPQTVAITLTDSGPGPYLEYPRETSESQHQMQEILTEAGLGDLDAPEVMRGLCETVAVFQSVQICGRVEHQIMMDELESLTPTEQLRRLWEPVVKAGIGAVPWCLGEGAHAAALKMWTSPFLAPFKTLADFCDITTVQHQALLLGHSDFIGFDLIQKAFAMESDMPAVFPFYLVNYLLDEMRHEEHVIGIACLPGKKLVVVDPNGVCPDDFGEPNAVMVKLPWKTAKKRRKN